MPQSGGWRSVLAWEGPLLPEPHAEPCMPQFGGLKVQGKHSHSWTILKELKPFGLLPPRSHTATVGMCTEQPCCPAPAHPGQLGPNLCVSISTSSRGVENEAQKLLAPAAGLQVTRICKTPRCFLQPRLNVRPAESATGRCLQHVTQEPTVQQRCQG